MTIIIENYQIEGTPPPWSVTSIKGFIVGALQRLQRDGLQLPEQFFFTICPWGERNALGGTPEPVQEVSDPRLRLVHFTGCGRPYLVILFLGADMATRQQVAMDYLPWSEHLSAVYNNGQLVLKYLGCTGDVSTDSATDPRTLRMLLDQGALAKF